MDTSNLEISIEATCEQLSRAMLTSDITPPRRFILDGKLHRYNSRGGIGRRTAWYVVHFNTLPAGAFGCTITGFFEPWSLSIGRELTPPEETTRNSNIKAALNQATPKPARRKIRWPWR